MTALSRRELLAAEAIDRERFARVRTLRGEMALAGFAWTESMEADHIEVVRPAPGGELLLVADYRLYATIAWV